MARFNFRLPDIGEGIAEAEIVAWHVKVGDVIAEDQQLADMMTDKATVEMESPVAGKVLELAGEVGDQIPIGSVLVVIETEGEEAPAGEGSETDAKGERTDEVAIGDGLVAPTPAQEEAIPSLEEKAPLPHAGGDEPRSGDRGGSVKAAPEGQAAPPPTPPAGGRGGALASPAVRARARDLGIDLAQVKTASDRVRHADLDAYLLYSGGSVSPRGAARRADEDVKVVGLRRKIAENMQEAKRRIPHFTYVEEYDVTDLEATRAMMNRDRGDNPKLTMLPFLITAMCKALRDYPQINARYDDEANVIHRSGAVHMGMATQTDNGLSVAVIRDADGRDLWGLSREIKRLADAARAGKASRDELSGSTITISSLGPMGGVVSTPVINRPEVAIIAVNKVEDRVVVVDGELEIRKRMNLSISCDHRVVDGWDAASFMQDLKKLIESPLKLLSA
ncbi:dihydrolipoamide acetyltransferase family protein [Allosphingosinicella indica]|uniref:Dihydrolipoamide acetyltransferase component of pyruvate dehydrogenase complex n=1 Tax=Allosphingosinicella indica TaxID=941907 RepID=A0A1X7GIN3_9SPHN|nr:dihydrolipoamide acetyltransferase family protein [Allosphingosinicella indica]SMF70326.1 branched-chain alpha-keto acid dehydrogenase E2 component [Allosphingosinicella indica]